MVNGETRQHPTDNCFRQSIRLTFFSSEGAIKLISQQKLKKICPPSIGPRPEIGKNSGEWLELRDEKDNVLYHKTLMTIFNDSVSVHSPDGQIRRVFGKPTDITFEVLIPDLTNAKYVVLIGNQPGERTEKEGVKGSIEISRFDLNND